MEILSSMWRWGGARNATSEQALLEGARRGEHDSLDTLYRRHATSAYSLALRITGHPDRAEDVVQEAFLRAFQRLGDFRGDAPFSAWLKRVVANIAIDRIRSERRWLADEAVLDGLQAIDSGVERPLDALGLLQRLPAAARTVVVLHDLEGYSHDEIATLCGHSESWSKSTLSRARARLRSWLERGGDDES